VHFFLDMGECPPTYEIDRIDVNGNYSCGHCEQCIAHDWPMNCRWTTSQVNALNQRRRLPYRQDAVSNKEGLL
jgi:hypothetical protein